LLFSVMMCGCTAAKKTAAPACPAYPNNGLTLNPGNYCVTSSAASYEIGDQESTVNTYTVSATLQSNPPIPAGTPLRVGFENVGGVEGSFVQMVSTGSPTIAFSETVTTPSTQTCLPNPTTINLEATLSDQGSSGGILQANWTSIPQACSN
jgi:hypothetical protein